MQVECLTMRAGTWDLDIKEQRIQMQPIAGAFEGESTTSMATINDPEILDYLLGNKEKNIKGRPNFRVYNQQKAYQELLERRKENAAKMGRYKGYSFRKVTSNGVDRGYMLVDERDRHPLFLGADGEWRRTSPQEPFQNLKAAEDALMAIVDGLEAAPAVSMKAYPCQEPGCTESFDDPIQLSDHWKAAHQKPTQLPLAGSQQQQQQAGPEKADEKKPYRTPETTKKG